MSRKILLKRYVRMLFYGAKDAGVLDHVLKDLEAIHELAAESGEFRDFTQNPVISEDKKLNLMADMFEKKIHPFTLTFLKFLCSKDRGALIPDIFPLFEEYFLEHHGRQRVTTITRDPLTKEQMDSIRKHLSKMLGKDIEVLSRIDESMIGGIQIRYGDHVLDKSLNAMLQNFKRSILQTG